MRTVGQNHAVEAHQAEDVPTVHGTETDRPTRHTAHPMTPPIDPPTRRTVLRTLGAATVGGALASSGVGGAAAGTATRQPSPDLRVVSGHDHETHEHSFDVSTTEVGAGWTTIQFENPTEHTHFVYLAKLPQAAIDDAEAADVGLLDFYVEHVTKPFQWFMDTNIPGKEPDPEDLSGRYEGLFPPWFSKVLPSGGVGFTSSETTSTTTVNLASGQYIMECYMKTESGDFHSYHGMIELLTVTEGSTGSAPEPTLELSVSTEGIDAPDKVGFGEHTVAVTFEDQQLYSHLLGHDVHLVRLAGGTTTADVNGWTNWLAPEGLVADGSEPTGFLGGVEQILTPDLLAGNSTETGYIHVSLPPGRYAWVAEVPDPAGKGLLQPFVVASPDTNAPGRIPAGGGMPEAGSSRNHGMAGEPADDDLSERAANSRMPDWAKDAFDLIANRDSPGGQ